MVSSVIALQAWTLVNVFQLAREVAVLQTQITQLSNQVASLEERNERMSALISNLRSSTIRTRTNTNPPAK